MLRLTLSMPHLAQVSLTSVHSCGKLNAFVKNTIYKSIFCIYNNYIQTNERNGMQIQVKDNSDNGEVFVRGVYGPRTTKRLLEQINASIQRINKELRRLYE